MKNKENAKRRKILFILLLIGFLAVEIPGILIVGDKVYPFILGLPFFYAYLIIAWAYMVAVLYLGYRCQWGKKPFFSTSAKEPD